VGGYVLPAEASVMADGTAYGLEGAVSFWEDPGGGWHDAGWPSCLASLGGHQIRFGWVSVSASDGLQWREVVSVACP